MMSTAMQRLVEQPTDEGEVFDGGDRLGRVHYHLSVYQHFLFLLRAFSTDSPPNYLESAILSFLLLVDQSTQ